jgi:NhaP-type Na+/H+ or K+/H+ antiporter
VPNSANQTQVIIILGAYASFFIAEMQSVKVSGVLAVVVYGFFMAAHGQYAIEAHHLHSQHAIVSKVSKCD